MVQKNSPASHSIPHVEGPDMVGLLQEMIDHLVNFGFEQVKMTGEAHINRTTEPVVRFLLWLQRTPEAEAALRLAFLRVASKPYRG